MAPQGSPQSAASASAAQSAATSTGGGGGARATHPPGRDPGRDDSGRGARGLAIAALIVAIVAIVGTGWLWFTSQSRVETLASHVDSLQNSVQSSQSNMTQAIKPKLASLRKRVQALSGQLQDRQQDQQRIQKNVAQLKQQIKSVQTQSARLAQRFNTGPQPWDLRRIESLLMAANQRLLLYHDPQSAQQALKLASQAIGRMNDPQLFKIRSTIAKETAALAALPHPDIENLSLKLAAQINQVPKLPLASNMPSTYRHGSQGNASGATQANQNNTQNQNASTFGVKFTQGWDQFVASAGHALSQMVTIRRGNGTQPALMPPPQASYLAQNLELELRTARLALLKDDTQSYRDSLASARKWLKKYYDTSDSRVSGMLNQLKQINNVKLNWQAPDISASLHSIRQLIAQQSQKTGGAQQEQASGQAGGSSAKPSPANGSASSGQTSAAKKPAGANATGQNANSGKASSQKPPGQNTPGPKTGAPKSSSGPEKSGEKNPGQKPAGNKRPGQSPSAGQTHSASPSSGAQSESGSQ